MLILESEICTVLVRALVYSPHYLQLLPVLLPPEFLLFINYFESAHINSRLIQPVHTQKSRKCFYHSVMFGFYLKVSKMGHSKMRILHLLLLLSLWSFGSVRKNNKDAHCI